MRTERQKPTEIPGLAARRIAVTAVDQVLRQRRRLDEALESDLRLVALDGRDRAFATALSRITLRRLGEIMEIVEAHLDRGWPARCGYLKALLACGAAQLLYMEVASHAAVDQAVRLAREDRDGMHFTGLVNAILRAITRAPKPQPRPLANLPAWLQARWRASYGDEVAAAMASAQLEEAPLDLTPRSDPAGWAERLGGRLLASGSIRLADHHGPISGLAGYAEGAWWVQDAAALLVVRAAGDVRRKRVLDLCAAPGGKTAALAASGARVTAVDRDPHRLARLMLNMDRLKLKVEPIVRDMMEADLGEPYDVVLLDAPCSATGTLRRHPDVAWLKRESDIDGLARTQAAMLVRAASLVAPGGVLIYSTCSLEPEEGEQQIPAFIRRCPAFAVEAIRQDESSGMQGMTSAEGYLRIRPDMLAGEGGIDGFFVARLRKQAQI